MPAVGQLASMRSRLNNTLGNNSAGRTQPNCLSWLGIRLVNFVWLACHHQLCVSWTCNCTTTLSRALCSSVGTQPTWRWWLQQQFVIGSTYLRFWLLKQVCAFLPQFYVSSLLCAFVYDLTSFELCFCCWFAMNIWRVVVEVENVLSMQFSCTN